MDTYKHIRTHTRTRASLSCQWRERERERSGVVEILQGLWGLVGVGIVRGSTDVGLVVRRVTAHE